MFCLIFTAFYDYGSGVTAMPVSINRCFNTEQECKAKLYSEVEQGRTVIKLNNNQIAAVNYFPNSGQAATTITCAKSLYQ